jgi:large subunit ribosomal protein L9
MKVILRADITNVGRQGDIKEVSAGFARNFLVPKKLAMQATPQNLKIWEREKVRLEKIREEIIAAAKVLAEKIEATPLSIKVKVGDNGKIFGSVTSANISDLFKAAGLEVSKKDVLLAQPLKETGTHNINVRLHPEVVAKAVVEIIEEKN